MMRDPYSIECDTPHININMAAILSHTTLQHVLGHHAHLHSRRCRIAMDAAIDALGDGIGRRCGVRTLNDGFHRAGLRHRLQGKGAASHLYGGASSLELADLGSRHSERYSVHGKNLALAYFFHRIGHFLARRRGRCG